MCVCVCVCVCISHLLYPILVQRHLGCFHILAIANSAAIAAMNIGVCESFQITVFSRYMPRSGIAGSYSSSIFNCYKSIIISHFQ